MLLKRGLGVVYRQPSACIYCIRVCIDLDWQRADGRCKNAIRPCSAPSANLVKLSSPDARARNDSPWKFAVLSKIHTGAMMPAVRVHEYVYGEPASTQPGRTHAERRLEG